MSRAVLPAFYAAVTANRAVGALLVELGFRTGWLWLWTGVGDLTWKSRTFKGAGQLVGMGGVVSNNSVQANGLTFSLSGIPLTAETKSVLTSIQQETRQGRPGRMWFALFDAAGSLISEPDLVFDGLMDAPLVRLSATGFDIAVACESRLARLQTRPGLRWDNETQRASYPTDRGFENVAAIQNKVA